MVIALHDRYIRWFIQSDRYGYLGNIRMYENKCFCEFIWSKVQLGKNKKYEPNLKTPLPPQTTTCSKMFTAYLNKNRLLHQIKLAHSINYFDD